MRGTFGGAKGILAGLTAVGGVFENGAKNLQLKDAKGESSSFLLFPRSRNGSEALS